jgi:hypothetical protein
MLQQLINHSPDLQKLSDEGYELVVSGGHLLVHHIPYLNSRREVKYGTLVDVLTYATTTQAGKPKDHTIYLQGETPCDTNGNALTAIINNSNPVQLSLNILVNHYFSSKPAIGYYVDYYEKIRTYSEILSAQAKAIDKSVTTKPNKKNG